MKAYHLKEDNFSISKWSGGKTKELAIYPQKSQYSERNFTWRISSATCELDESDFTKLPDYDRILMVLEGEVVLNYDGTKTVRLGELEQDSFDGAWNTKSYGRIVDFNLMVRKGNEGHVDILHPEKENREFCSTHDEAYSFKKMSETHALLVKEGYALVSYREKVKGEFGEETVDKTAMVKAGELLVLECEPLEDIKYKLMGEGTVIRSQICYEAKEGETCAIDIPEEKATFDDFVLSMFIANTQFHGARYIFRSLQKTWYDEALSKKIKKLEKMCATVIAYMAGMVLILSVVFKSGVSDATSMLYVGIWTLIDIFIVSPVIFFLALPKPVRKHIKNVDELTPYEQKVREKELNTNEKIEKILRKTYGGKYQEHGSRSFLKSLIGKKDNN